MGGADDEFLHIVAVKIARNERAETPSATTVGGFHAAMVLASSMVTQNDNWLESGASYRDHCKALADARSWF
jgi:hypothetical protein